MGYNLVWTTTFLAQFMTYLSNISQTKKIKILDFVWLAVIEDENVYFIINLTHSRVWLLS